MTETLIDSAEAAREQKAVFSETFQHLFDSVEKLSNLQKMLLGEFIGEFGENWVENFTRKFLSRYFALFRV